MEKTEFKHSYKEFGYEAIKKRVQQMLEFRDEVDVENAHVKLSYGNRKTGALVPSVRRDVMTSGTSAFRRLSRKRGPTTAQSTSLLRKNTGAKFGRQ